MEVSGLHPVMLNQKPRGRASSIFRSSPGESGTLWFENPCAGEILADLWGWGVVLNLRGSKEDEQPGGEGLRIVADS